MKTYILFVPKVNPSVIPYYPQIGNQPLHTTRKPLHDETGGSVRKSSFLGCQFARCTGFLTFALVLAMRIFSVPPAPLHLLDFIPDSILASGEGSPQCCST